MNTNQDQLTEEFHRTHHSPSGKPGNCIDAYCICGKHRCPIAQLKLPFEGNSTYRTTYQANGSEVYNQIKNRMNDVAQKLSNQQVLSIPFSGNSTMRSVYHSFPPSAIYKNQPKMIEMPALPENRDFSTCYNSNYRPYTIKTCPAAYLPCPPATSEYNHIFYDVTTNSYY